MCVGSKESTTMQESRLPEGRVCVLPWLQLVRRARTYPRKTNTIIGFIHRCPFSFHFRWISISSARDTASSAVAASDLDSAGRGQGLRCSATSASASTGSVSPIISCCNSTCLLLSSQSQCVAPLLLLSSGARWCSSSSRVSKFSRAMTLAISISRGRQW